MYPHTITIYHLEKTLDTDTITKYIINGVYYHSAEKMTANDTRFDVAHGVEIDVNCDNSRNCKVTNPNGTWAVKEGDRVVLGAGADVTALKELKNAKVVTGIDINMCGSPLDNIVIYCE